MSVVSDCPPPAWFHDLLAERLAPDRADELEAHLNVCPVCRDRLHSLSDPPVGSGPPVPPSACDPNPSFFRRLADLTASPWRETTLPDLPGYDLLETIGRGGMGVVYKARQRSLNRLVAIKMIRAGRQASPDESARFAREAEAVARLQHPNVVQIYEVGEHDGLPFLALEYVPGGTLADQLRGTLQPIRRAVELVRTVALAIDAAHRAGVVHRDLKPANILISTDGSPKVTDFGLAKSLGDARDRSETGTFAGTPAYMAPEQVGQTRGRVGPATDVYALGAILYEMIAGRPPFGSADAVETLLHVLHTDPVGPRALRPDLPRDLETVCLYCLRKNPDRRYPTAAALAADLDRFLAGQPVCARATPAWERAAKAARRNPVAAVALATALAAVGGGFTAVTILWQHAQDQATAEADANRAARESEYREKHARREVERLSADLVIGQGIDLCQKGEVARGMHWLLDGLEMATQLGDEQLQRVARANLGAWRSSLFTPLARIPHGPTRGAVWAADGDSFWTFGTGRAAVRRSVRTGDSIGQPLSHPAPVLAGALSPDGTVLLTGSGEPERPGTARLWDARLHTPISPPWHHPGPVERVAFRPDGRGFFTVSRGQVRLWNFPDSRPLNTPLLPVANPDAAAFSPDGRLIVTTDTENSLRCYASDTGRPCGKSMPHPQPVRAFAFSPDGRTLASIATMTRRVFFWDAATGEAKGLSLQHPGPVLSLAFSPDGQTLATGCRVRTDPGLIVPQPVNDDGEARLWDVAEGRLIHTPVRHPRPVTCVAFGPDGRLLATGAEDRYVRFYQAETGTAVGPPVPAKGKIEAVAFDAHARALLIAGVNELGGTAGAWAIPPSQYHGRPVRSKDRTNAVAFSPDGRLLLTGNRSGSPQVWDAASGRSVSPGPDDRELAAGMENWEEARDQRVPPPGPDGSTPLRVVGPGRKLAVVGEGAHGLRLRERKSGDAIGPCVDLGSRPAAVAFVPGSESLVVVTGDSRARLIDPRSGRVLRAWRYPEDVWAVAVSPDGKTVASCGRGPTARLWDLATGEALGLPMTHNHCDVAGVAFSPDGRTVATAGRDGTARLWDAASGRPVGPPLAHPGKVLAVAFRPDGRQLASGCEDRTTHLWNLPMPIDGDLATVRFWVEAATGLDHKAAGRVLSPKMPPTTPASHERSG